MRTHLLYKKYEKFTLKWPVSPFQRHWVSLVADTLDLSKPIVFKDYTECTIKGYIGEFIVVKRALRKYV